MGEFFVRRPIVAMVISIIIIILGLLALQKTPVAQYPDIVPPLVKITTSFTGANAINVEQAVATPIEQKVNGVENMLYMKSINTSDGALTVEVTFDVGTDLDNANMLTQNKEKQAEPFLPQSVKQQGVSIKKSLSFPMMIFTITSSDPKYDGVFLNNYAYINVIDALARIKGVGDCILFAGSEYSMRIWLQPGKMSSLGITVDEVKKALNDQNMITPGGKFGAEPAPLGTDFTYSVTLQDRLVTQKQFSEIIVKSKEDGAKVLLSDIARIELGTENYSSTARRNGKPSAAIGIFQMPGSNALDVAAKAKEAMEEISKRFPENIEYQVSLDTTTAITAGVEDIIHTLFEAILLVILVVFIFLQNWRATLIPLITVPVSLIGTIAVFPMLGFSINTLSLLGLVLAIGIVVDDAIVVVEAVVHHIEHGKTPKEATIQAMREVSGPVIAIALILIAVFVPVAMTPGITGRFYQQFAITIAVSVAFSAFSALSLSPALCAMLLKPTKPVEEQTGWLAKFFAGFNRIFENVTGRYINGATFFAKKSLRIIILLVVVLGAVVLLGKKVPLGFIPEEDQGYILVNISTPPASSLQRTDEVTRKIESILSKEETLDCYTTINGYSLLTSSYLPANGFIFIALKPWEERTHTAKQIADKLNAQFATKITNATVMAFGPPAIQGLGASAGFSMMLQDRGGNTPQYLAQQTQAFIAEAQKRPEIKRIYTTYNAGTPQIKLEIDNDKAMKLGVPVSKVTEVLGTFLGGTYVNDFNRFGRQYKVYLQGEAVDRVKPENLNLIYVKNDKGDMLPISTLVTATKVSGPDFTNRLNLFRSAEIGGAPNDGYSSAQALDALEEVAKTTLPSDMSYDYINLSYQEKHSPGGGTVFAMALVFVFLILAAQYESWKLPFSVLLGAPFAVFGAFLGLFLARFASDAYVNNVFAQIGLVLLIGLVAKNAILIVEFAKEEYEKGKPLYESAMVAARLRFRPILMTAFAFILGVVPLLTATGAGSQARIVMGMAVFSGMLIATVLGVLIVPGLFVMIEKIGHKKEETITTGENNVESNTTDHE
ncbi:efflux RND transporter permease subunit [Flavobacterium tyrosinilyticum]|uniref:efflux RND transporter permease subunit n=1 Tax=Flavobacterium tyrosinilyticum TaxID=1658740 RepID=UPI00202F7717|nr:multidrug efflux RND transporter permease subunit [Flavobacterium tyrosinilyticum]MCM0665549.1 multidrug efflux RND transporter permease subunit [Flavobacterium tyrosinilyticum]